MHPQSSSPVHNWQRKISQRNNKPEEKITLKQDHVISETVALVSRDFLEKKSECLPGRLMGTVTALVPDPILSREGGGESHRVTVGNAHLPLTQEVQSSPGMRTQRCSLAPRRKHCSPSPWQEGERIKDIAMNCQKSSQLSLGCHPTHTKQTASCSQMQNPASAQVCGISMKSTQTGLAGKGQAGNSFCVPRRCCCEVLWPLPKGQT